MKYENIIKFQNTTKASKSKIYRFYKKNQELFLESKLKNGKRLFPSEHARYFNSEIMHDDNKILRQENSSMKNLINCLMDRNSLSTRLWYLDWSFFFTIAYQTDRNKRSCFRQMHGLYEYLDNKFGEETNLRVFFTTEQFIDRVGYHNHFVIHIINEKLHQEIVAEIQNYFEYDRVDVTNYDKFKAGLFYVAKTGLVNEDWDILGNNLKEDGLKI